MSLRAGSGASRAGRGPGLLLLGLLLLLPAVVAHTDGEDRGKEGRDRVFIRPRGARFPLPRGAFLRGQGPARFTTGAVVLLYRVRYGLQTRKGRPQVVRNVSEERLGILGVTTPFPALISSCPSHLQRLEDPEEGEGELQCMCVKTTSGVHPKHIMSLEVIRAGPHCPISQLM